MICQRTCQQFQVDDSLPSRPRRFRTSRANTMHMCFSTEGERPSVNFREIRKLKHERVSTVEPRMPKNTGTHQGLESSRWWPVSTMRRLSVWTLPGNSQSEHGRSKLAVRKAIEHSPFENLVWCELREAKMDPPIDVFRTSTTFRTTLLPTRGGKPEPGRHGQSSGHTLL